MIVAWNREDFVKKGDKPYEPSKVRAAMISSRIIRVQADVFGGEVAGPESDAGAPVAQGEHDADLAVCLEETGDGGGIEGQGKCSKLL
jgi:hypothetical protein